MTVELQFPTLAVDLQETDSIHAWHISDTLPLRLGTTGDHLEEGCHIYHTQTFQAVCCQLLAQC